MRSPDRICCKDTPCPSTRRTRQDCRGQVVLRGPMGQFNPERPQGLRFLRWMHELVPQQIWTQRSFVARLCINVLDAVILPQFRGLLFGRRIPSLAAQNTETMAQTAQERVPHCRGLSCGCWVVEVLSRPVGDRTPGCVTDTGDGFEIDFPESIAAELLKHGNKYRFLYGRRIIISLDCTHTAAIPTAL